MNELRHLCLIICSGCIEHQSRRCVQVSNMYAVLKNLQRKWAFSWYVQFIAPLISIYHLDVHLFSAILPLCCLIDIYTSSGGLRALVLVQEHIFDFFLQGAWSSSGVHTVLQHLICLLLLLLLVSSLPPFHHLTWNIALLWSISGTIHPPSSPPIPKYRPTPLSLKLSISSTLDRWIDQGYLWVNTQGW